jgi:hypothetical protein
MRKMKQGLSIAAIGGVIAVILGVIALWGKADACIDSRIDRVAKEVIGRELKSDLRDLKIMIEYNKMQAMQSEETKDLWNRAIDRIDNLGRVSGVTK